MFVCPQCKRNIVLNAKHCANCNLEYDYSQGKFIYNYDKLLFESHKDNFLLNKVLNNNGYISYKFLADASLSLSTRKDVIDFKNYIYEQITIHKKINKKINFLDVGCGLLELPGYLDFDLENVELFGIEPIHESKFKGNLIIGCSEYIPLEANSMDYIIFATSLDHVCSLVSTIHETHRVLKSDGKVIIWMSDQSKSLFEYIKDKLRILKNYFTKGYRTDLYYVYPNYTVLGVPHGAVDPFHSFFESPNTIKKLFTKNGFKFDNMNYITKNQVFLTFSKLED